MEEQKRLCTPGILPSIVKNERENAEENKGWRKRQKRSWKGERLEGRKEERKKGSGKKEVVMKDKGRDRI